MELATVIIGTLSLAQTESKDKRQIASAGVDSGLIGTENGDSQVAETGFAGAVASGSKYFQYAHQPAKDHYEHGHKRGNEHHFIERHEKAHPHAGEFKTKVRWGDKHGGYGEHYWDYNHAGHGDDGDEGETVQHEQYVRAPAVSVVDNQEKIPASFLPVYTNRKKRQPYSGDVEFINDKARYKILRGVTSKHGGNYRRAPGSDRAKRGHNLRAAQSVYAPKRTVDNQEGDFAFGWKPVQFKNFRY